MRSLMQAQLGLLLFLPVLCTADPHPEPEPVPEAGPEAQTFTNNAPFSGAIYIVDPNGQQITAQGQDYCPSFALQSCGSMGSPSWCCPSGYTCATVANSGIIGCCPVGSSCAGAVNGAAVTTITVQAAPPQTSVVYVQPSTVVTAAQNPQPSEVVNQGGFCSTLTMHGDNLPTTGQGACGVILIVNESATVSFGIGHALVLVLLQFVIGVVSLAFWV